MTGGDGGVGARADEAGGEVETSGVWWVDQGLSYEAERDEWVVFAAAGGDRLARLRPGDVTLHGARRYLRAVGVVHAPATAATRPRGGTDPEPGTAARVEYFELDAPVPVDGLPSDLGLDGREGGCVEVPAERAEALRGHLAGRWPAGSPWAEAERRYWSFQAEPGHDLAARLDGWAVGNGGTWTASKHRGEMQPGDGVMLWATAQGAGAYALGRLTGAADPGGAGAGDGEWTVPLALTRRIAPPMLMLQVKANPHLRGLGVVTMPWAGTNQAMTEAQWRAVVTSLPLGPGGRPGGRRPSARRLADEMYYPVEFVAKVLRLVEHKKQVVFYGPPGTGKTYFARALAAHLAAGGDTVETVQFHPSYSYEEFVEGYRPRTIDGQLSYEVVDGPLKRLALTAAAHPDRTHVLIVDELNRALVSKVLGELYFLLEYRNESIRLQYSEQPFRLPPNLVLIATMNTADRSIALVDAALRRRFHFVGLYPDQPPVSGLLGRFLAGNDLDVLAWLPAVVDAANGLVPDRHLALGPSHFLRPDLTEADVELIWEHSVMPYFEEQFLDAPEQLARFELPAIRKTLG
jgi:hypothetical protein